MAIDVNDPGEHEAELAGAFANLSRRANVDWYDDQFGGFSAGTVDTTASPYDENSVEGQSVICAFPSAEADAGIWVLGSHADPAAVPVTRRADSETGAVFTTDEKIIINATPRRYVTAAAYGAGPIQQGVIGTHSIEFLLHQNAGYAALALGNGDNASGQYSTTLGHNTTASGEASHATGETTTASGNFSVATGSGAVAYLHGMEAHQTLNLSGAGGSQKEAVTLGATTSDDTPTALTLDGASEKYVLPNSCALAFTGTVVGMSAADAAGYKFEGVITRGANAAATALVAAVTTEEIAASAGASAWDVSVTANTSDGALEITVTGAAATGINWVARVDGVKFRT